MKLLFVAPYLPSPPRFGGQKRFDALMRGLSGSHQVSLLAFAPADAAKLSQVAQAHSYCHELCTVPEPYPSPSGKRLRQVQSLLCTRSYEGLLLRQPRFQKELDRLLFERSFDVVQVEFCQMAGYELRRPGAAHRLVLDEHNIEYEIPRRTAAAGGSLARRLYNEINWRKLKREELAAWRRFDGVAVTSEPDQRLLLGQVPTANTAVVPNGVDVEAIVPSSAPAEPDNILFFGAMNYYPNIDGVLHFIDRIFPLIREKRPGVKLWVVGPEPPQKVRERASEAICVTGFVDSLEPYLARASVIVVPLRSGGGTRLKIVEAMAAGKAIVSTELGAEGLDIVSEEHAILADEPQDFAEQTCRVLSEPALAVRLGQEARKLAEARYSWAAAVRKLEGFYESLASG